MAKAKAKRERKVHPYSAECGMRIRKFREDANLSQAELARLAGYTEQYISAIELGYINMPTETLCRIAHALLVPPAQLHSDLNVGHARLLNWLAHVRPDLIKRVQQFARDLETLQV